eukprot:5614727-Amphidinium_carterae.12
MKVWKVKCGGFKGKASFLYCSNGHPRGVEDFVDVVKLAWSVEGGCVYVVSLLVVFVECGSRIVGQDFDGFEVGCFLNLACGLEGGGAGLVLVDGVRLLVYWFC